MPKIFNGVATREQHFNLLNAYRTRHPEDITLNLGEWWEIQPQEHDYFLGVLPPRDWQNGTFLMSENLTDGVTSAYFNFNVSGKANRYFHGYSVTGPTSRAYRQTMQQEIRDFLASEGK